MLLCAVLGQQHQTRVVIHRRFLLIESLETDSGLSASRYRTRLLMPSDDRALEEGIAKTPHTVAPAVDAASRETDHRSDDGNNLACCHGRCRRNRDGTTGKY